MKNEKKITKLSDLNQIDGKIHQEDEKGNSIPTTLEQILGGNSILQKYGTEDLEEYKRQLDSMNVAELRTHAVKLAKFVPNSNRDKLVKQLMGEFTKFTSVFHRPNHRDKNIDLSKDKLADALKIMSAIK